MYGAVTHYNERGFGFLYSAELQRRVFFHIRDFAGAVKPVADQHVRFDLAPSGKPGQPDIAVNVVVEPTAGINALLTTKIETVAGVEVTTSKVGA